MVTLEALDRLVAVAQRAGRAILDTTADATATKPDGSPVTAADRASHAVIGAELRAWTPAIPVISEEGEVPPYDQRRGWPRVWLVDPLDGTKEFLARNGEFTVNIALIEGGAPVLGVVFAPATDLLYVAGRGLGAWKQSGTRARQAVSSAPAPAGDALVIVESRSHPSAALETYLGGLSVRRRIQAGSSLKFCLVAEGAADVYPRFGRTMEWDTAAGDCVYRTSGRERERWSPLRYNTASLAHESFVIGLAGPDDRRMPTGGAA